MTSIAVDGSRTRAKRGASTRRARRHDGPEPWSRRHVSLLAVVLAVVVGVLVVGWAGISGTVDLNSQTRWLGLGITAVMAGGFAMTVWLLTGMQAVAVLRREVLTELDLRYPVEVAAPEAPARADFGTVAGMKRYHDASCLMLLGKDVTFADAASHVQAGLLPCGICLAEASHE
jgi:hypothetical protein